MSMWNRCPLCHKQTHSWFNIHYGGHNIDDYNRLPVCKSCYDNTSFRDAEKPELELAGGG